MEYTHETLAALADEYDGELLVAPVLMRAHASAWQEQVRASDDYILAMMRHDDAMAFGTYKTMDEYNGAVERLRDLQTKWRVLRHEDGAK